MYSCIYYIMFKYSGVLTTPTFKLHSIFIVMFLYVCILDSFKNKDILKNLSRNLTTFLKISINPLTFE